jgi:uncharacterized protein (TIGR01777 family)
MRILITGGTGFIGRALCQHLAHKNHQITVLSRRPNAVKAICGKDIGTLSSLDLYDENTSFDVIINLAGEPIMEHRWSSAYKRTLWQSRVELTRQLVHKIERANYKPRVLISGSAIGIYGQHFDQPVDETTPITGGFSHALCKAWEDEALRAETQGVRVAIVRTGLVIGKDGGFLSKMLLPFKLGLGGPIGDGTQWMSWIHLEDEIALIEFLIDHAEARGAFNATAPLPVTNAIFTKALANRLHRPAIIASPKWLLNLLLGERSSLLIESQRVLPKRASDLGFTFKFRTLEDALSATL